MSHLFSEIWKDESKSYPVFSEKYSDLIIWINANNENDLPSSVWFCKDLIVASWFRYNKRHRDGDKPAVICYNGSQFIKMTWMQNDLIYREGDKPEEIYPDGTKIWYKYNEYHRDDDKPAIEYGDGSKEWYNFGNKHRFIGPSVVLVDGTMEWRTMNKLDRGDDQPAIVFNDGHETRMEWFVKGVRHRNPDKGAAFILVIDGRRIEETWWEHGKVIKSIREGFEMIEI
jgi:hypothetical protein